MNATQSSAYNSHESASLLLPWYVNGSLDDDERRLVDEHLAVCLTCRSELRTQRRIAAVVQSSDRATVGADIGLAQLRRRIRPQRPSLPERLRDGWNRWLSAPLAPWAAGAALAVTLAVMLPLLYHPGDEPVNPETYRTLSAGDARPAFPANSLRLVFAQGTGETTRQEILQTVNAITVSAPSPGGVLTVQVPRGELAAALALLRKREEVQLAEPVFSAGEAAGSD